MPKDLGVPEFAPETIKELVPDRQSPWQPERDWYCVGLGQHDKRQNGFQNVRDYLAEIAGGEPRFHANAIGRCIESGGLRAYQKDGTYFVTKLDVVEWAVRGFPTMRNATVQELTTWLQFNKGMSDDRAAEYVRSSIEKLQLKPDRRQVGRLPQSLKGKTGSLIVYSLKDLKSRIEEVSAFSEYRDAIKADPPGRLLRNCKPENRTCSLVLCIANSQFDISDPFARGLSVEEFSNSFVEIELGYVPVRFANLVDGKYVVS